MSPPKKEDDDDAKKAQEYRMLIAFRKFDFSKKQMDAFADVMDTKIKLAVGGLKTVFLSVFTALLAIIGLLITLISKK